MEIFQKGKFSLADEILTPDFVLHNPVLPPELSKGSEGVKRFASFVADSSSSISKQIQFHSITFLCKR
jgi:hypothetical protein